MKKKISARKIIFISTLSLITIISVILTLVFVFSGDVKAIELNRNYGKYESNQGIYTKENIPTSNYISMTEAADKTYSLKDYTITISTPDELSLFSNKCDPYNSSYNSSFLGYTYKILNNIDCDGASNSFVPVGFNEPFSGTFDGNGFEIKNLNFINLVNGNDIAKKYMYSSDNDNEYYIQYFAMFSKNSGTIQNLGLISPSIVLSYTPKGESYIAPLVGVNSGTIQYCYHKMLESNNENSSGISSQGGFFISGLVSKNTSTITSVYSAVTILSQTSSTEVLTQAEIANENTGTITNAYFYDETITNYIAINGKVSIEFDQSKVSNNLKDADHPGEYCKTISILTNSFDNSDEFYTLKDYNEEIQVYLKNSKGEFIYETPILRGIKEDSGKTFIINNENEFLYMYELFNLNANFASSSFTYKIANDIDMSLIGIPTVTNNISATIISSSNSHVTIFNASISDYYVTNMGIDCYGLFPWFSGTLKNIDIVLGTSSTKYQFNPKESNNKKAYGALVGYLDGGVIDNCNVYISTIFNDNINEYSVGGVAGYVGSIDNKTIGTISNTVVNGTIENASSSTTNSQTFSKLGGAVGYIDYTTGTITNTLSTVEIISNSKCDLALGGLLGAGYINNFYNNQYGKKIDNTLYGNIAIDGSFKYASGLIGRLLGVTNQIDSVTNYGSITVSSNSDNESYLSGLMNVDIIKTASTDLPVSSLPLNNSGEYLFYASQLNSDCNIVVNGKNLNMHFTNGLNINTKNGFTSKISGLYNSTTKSGNTTSLLLNNISNFSALVNSICESSSSMVYLDTLLNSKNYTFTTSASISKSILVSGIANGKNINFVDIRNNGNLSFILSHTTENNPELIVNGVFEELSLNTTANNIYNAGNITVKDDAKAISTQATDSTTTTFETIDINIYASGICFKNLAEIDVDAQNPLKASYDNTLVGSLNNVINNGKILITSDGINESMSVYEVNVNTNQKQNSTQNSQTRFNGNIYFSGIAYLNSGIISNSFNLADIELNAYSRNDESIYAIGGICTYLGSQYSQIRDSANDGTLQLINISNIKKAKCYVGGIVGLNNYDKNSNTLNAIIAFTINYGTLVGFNGTENSIRSDSNVINYSCYVGGILSYGACNMVNVVNYGDIYGTEVVSSLISSFDLSIYNANSKFYLANTINYGKINLLEKYHYNGATFVEVTFKNLNVIRFKESALKYTTSGIYDVQNGITNYYYLGAMFGVVNFASRSYSNTIIRYVINFYNAPIVQSDNQINKPTTTNNNNTIDTSTFITVYGSTDEFGGGRIKYAPMTSVSDESGNIGVFSKNFIFRRAIDKDKTAVNFETYLTDNYISDFFEFVNFDKINTVLLDKIGWRSIAYANAAETLAKNIELMSKFVVNDNLNKSSINLAFTSSTWVSNIDSKIISDFLSYSIQSEELKEQYDSIVENVIFGENYKSAITQDIRKAIIKNLIEYYDNDKTDYEFLLQDLLYDDLLAKVISGENADYQLVQNKIISLLNSANDEELRKTLTNYLEMLIEDDNNEKLKIIFEDDTNNYYLQKKIDLINTLLDGFSEEAIATMAKDLIENATVSDVGIKAYNYLNDEQNKETAKSIYAIMVTSNNTSEEYLNALNKSFKKYNIDGIEKTDIEISNFYTDCSNESTSTGSATSTLSTYINGKSISYKKDYTELWNIVKNNTKFQKIVQDTFFTNNVDPTSSIGYYSLIAKATEYNNTYQSNDAPSTSPLEASLNSTTIKGKMQVNTNYGAINNRFIYTPDSVNSTATYYYGPFDRDGKLFSDTSLGKATEKFIGKDIYNVQSASRIADFYAPVFISTNKEITENYIAASNSTADNKTIATFYWHDGPDAGGSTRNQWVSDYILNGKNSKDGINFLFKNQNTGTYIIDGYNFTPNWSTSINEDLNQDNGYVIDSTNTKREIKLRNENKEGYAYVTTKVDGYQNDGNNYYTHPLKDYYLKGYITTAIYTGIWYMTSIWQDANNNNRTVGCYLMSQDTNNAHEVTGSNNKIYKGVQTTQYTYYQLDDLIRLDGIRTKSIDNPNAKDDTEVAIISAIMTSLLSEDSYKEVIINAVTEYAINNDFTESQYSTANLLANSLISTDFASNALINTFTLLSESALKNIKYNDGSLLTELTKIVNESEYSYSNKKLLNMVGATDKVTFKKLLLATLTDLTIYNKSDGTSISNYDFTYLLYRYIDYLKENEIKDKEDIANYIVSNSNDLKILSELANTDWDSFIDMYDGNADDSSFGIGYNSSTNLKKLYDKLNSQTQTISDGTPYVPANYALPISSKSEDLIPQSGKTTVTLSTGSKDVANATTQEANTNNIGYYVGDELKLYKETNISYDKFYYPNDSTQSIDLDSQVTTNKDVKPSPSNEIREYLNKKIDDSSNLINGNYLLRIANSQQYINGCTTNEGNLTYVKNGRVGNYSGDILLPKRTIWVAPVKVGVFKFVIVNTEKTTTSFAVHRLTRSIPRQYNSYFKNAESLTYFNGLLLPGKAYYFEIPISQEEIDAGYEYAISGGDEKKPYVAYIDMGTSGNESLKLTKYPNLSTIENNYNTNYLNHNLTIDSSTSTLSKFGLYLASNFINQVNLSEDSSITVENPSILLVRASSGSVTITGDTTYTYKEPDAPTTDSGTSITVDTVSKSFSNDSYRAFYLSGGSYNISSNNCTISEILLIDREASFSCTSDSETTPTIDTIKIKSGKNADEKLLYTGAKYEDLNSFNINLFDNTNTSYKDKIVTALATLYATYKSTTTTGTISKTVYELFNQEYIVEKLKENSDYKYSDNDKYLTNYQYLIKLMAEADYDGITSVFGKLINSAPSDFVIKLLLEYNDYSINKNIMTEIIKAVEKSNSGTYSNVEKYIIAAYLGQDYLNNTQQLTKTKLYELLNNYQSGEYQFIENDTTIDPEKFIDFINHLGGSANIDGYGIFALASSQGIKNGKFIPDNLDLSELDKFKADGSSSWRGGEKNNDNNTSDENSVNYHFYVSMKQLKKSISTSIIEIDLKDNNNNILFANSNQISDSVESINTKTITYYLTKSQFDSIDNGSSFTIDKNTLVYASKAKFYIGIDNSFNLYSDTINSIIVNKANDSLSTEYKIKIEAEDESVVTIYDIKFVIIDVDSTYNLSDDTSLGSIGGDVTLTFTTTNPMLNNADLTPFITIKKDNTSYNYLTTRDEFKKYFSFYTTGFYQVVKQTVNGEEIFYTATIKFSVDQSLPFGDYTVSVDVGTKPSIKMTKNKNNKAEIEYIEFDHQAVVVSSSMASTILFGRTFNDNDFSIDNGIPNYLTDFRISSNATAEIKYEVSSITSGLRQFKVTYTITAEDGTSASYTHTLIEKEPFEGNYATVYKDGNIITIDTTNVGYSLENGSYIKASDALNISFARNEGTPSFRIYFNLNNFYIDSNTTFNLIDVTSPESNQGKSYLISSYAGLTASITDNCELGTYSYQYTYIDSLNREFYFPIVNITKDYSTDSLISNLTFISSNISLGSAYTRISPNDALVTNENTSENQEKYYYDENEKYYSDFTNNKVTISNGAINYSDASVSGTNYYILGTVSDVQLSDYAPTMKIDDYAQIYQYTTPKKLAEYNGNQESSDTSILQTNGYFDDGIVYLYVPFYTDTNNNGVEDDTDNHIVCLVKMTIANDKKILSTIYNASGVTDDDKIGNFKEGTELKNIHNPDYIENTNYRVSQYSGREGNVSLNMNYIGNPSDGHFWYVSYAVFSESYIYNDSDTSSINFYHISIVDLTNNIYFTIKVNVPSTFQNYAIYLTVSYITYDKSGNTINNTLSCYVIKPTIQNEDGTYTFTTQYDLAMLPSGYFKFYLELPHGYSVTYTSSKENRLTSTDSHYEENKGSYLPPSSVVPQQIELTFNVSESNNDTSNSVWGEGNTSAITKEAEYKASSQDSEESQN